MNQALLIIDVQKGLFKKSKKIFLENLLIANINNLILKFSEKNNLIVYLQHNNKELVEGQTNWEIHDDICRVENSHTIQKTHGNAFDGTILEKILQDNSIDEIVITGLVSNGCVKATCIGGLALNYNVILVKDGHSNWNKDAENIIDKVNNDMADKKIRIIETKKLLSY